MSTLSLMKKGNAVPLAQGVDLHCLLQKGSFVQLLFPQLYAGDAAFQGAFHLLVQGLFAHPAAVGDRI